MKKIFYKSQILALLCPFLSECASYTDLDKNKNLTEENLEWDEAKSIDIEQTSSPDLKEAEPLPETESLPRIEELEARAQKEEKIVSQKQKIKIKAKKHIEKSPAKEISGENVQKQDLDQAYKQKLNESKMLYDQKIWHKAFLAFSELEREFDPAQSKGEPLYWIALCWYQMQEYRTAKAMLKRFIDRHPHNSLEGSARLFIAKSDLAIGHKEEAKLALKDIVMTYPKEESSQIARMILNKIKEEKL